MIPRLELRRLAYARLADPRALYLAGRYDAALYLCGYAVELALKARICRTLRWEGYPESRTEFANYGSFRIHDLPVLLELSGRKEQITLRHPEAWQKVQQWDPGRRYRPVGTATPDQVRLLITSARHIVRAL
jgi:HEPN domain-containing protein